MSANSSFYIPYVIEKTGRGESDRPRVRYEPALYRDQLLGLLDSLGLRTPVHILGFSFGGAVAAFNADVFWSDPPELMIPEPEAVLTTVRCVRDVYGQAMHGVLTTDRFKTEFEPVRVLRDDSEPIVAYARADWLRSRPEHVEPLGWAYCEGG